MLTISQSRRQKTLVELRDKKSSSYLSNSWVLDPVVIKEFLHQVQSALQKIDITYLEGGHFICDEQPHEVVKVIRKFLNEK